MISVDKLYISNDVVVSLKGFADSRAAAGEYLNAATVSCQIKTASGSDVGDAVTMNYVTDSNGEYFGVIQSEVTALLVDGGTYYVEVTATQGGIDGHWREQSVAGYRET